MARKAADADVKTPSSEAKYDFNDPDAGGASPTRIVDSGIVAAAAGTPVHKRRTSANGLDKVEVAREPSTLASGPLRQPRQAPRTVLPRQTGSDALFHTKPTQDHDAYPATSTAPPKESLIKRSSSSSPQPHRPDEMTSSGAYIPPGQQRNMRACMVCSIVRTHQQFLQQGCPNCEDILELINNPEQINDCTSQVFEGLITVADTKRSWVARYQRLEGYVPGVYATQVEGILPEDVMSAVENAGINYVPRDGSEQEMLPKD